MTVFARAGLALGLAITLPAMPGWADGLTFSTSGASRTDTFAAHSRLLDTRLARQYDHSARLRPPGAPMADAIPRYDGGYAGAWLGPAREAARAASVPEDLFLRLVEQESRWNTGALSPKGAIGLAQLMPGTAALLGVDAADPVQNLRGGARYLRRMYDRFGNWRLALAAYNAGPEAVAAHDGIPPYAETTAYVAAILER